jgi:hypothetical protein
MCGADNPSTEWRESWTMAEMCFQRENRAKATSTVTFQARRILDFVVTDSSPGSSSNLRDYSSLAIDSDKVWINEGINNASFQPSPGTHTGRLRLADSDTPIFYYADRHICLAPFDGQNKQQTPTGNGTQTQIQFHPCKIPDEKENQKQTVTPSTSSHFERRDWQTSMPFRSPQDH